jgi:dTMP kinase
MESRGSDYFQKVREGFLTEARRWPRGVEVVDANQTAEAIQTTIQQLLVPLVAENRQ